MNWKYEAIDMLKGYEARKRSMEIIPEEIKRLEEAMASIRSATSDGTPVQGGGNTREDMLLSNIVKRDRQKSSLRQAKLWVKNVDSALVVLTEEERLVLDRFYIHPAKGNVDLLCNELHVERSAVYDRRDKALRRFTIAFYGLEICL